MSFSPISIEDAIPMMIRIIMDMNLNRKIFPVIGPETMTYVTMIDRLGGLLKTRAIKVFVPVFLFRWIVRAILIFKKDFLVLDQIPRLLCDKYSFDESFAKLPDYKPRSLEEGFKFLIDRDFSHSKKS